MSSDSEQDMDDDVPWAPPEIRENYESALGRFLLMFNQIDFLLLRLTQTILARLNRDDLVKQMSDRDYFFRLYTLDILKSTGEGKGIESINVSALNQLSKDRAILAHAHMHQNPFDGSYNLIFKGKDKGDSFSKERIDGLTEKANELFNQLRYAEAYYEFCDLKIPEQIVKPN